MKFAQKSQKVTQGTILRYVYSSLYPPEETFGLIITARCDLANQSKGVQYVHYLPIVPLQSWVNKEVKQELLRNVFSEKYKSLDKEFEKAGLSLQASFEIDTNEFVIKTLKPKLPKQVTNYQELCVIKKAAESETVENDFTKYIKNKLEEKIKNIINNAEIAYHYIPWVDESKEYGEDFICLLREIHSIKFEIAMQAMDGISAQDFFSNATTFARDEIVWAVSEICSPDIEHIMQRFGNLFTRVGVMTRREHKVVFAGVK